MIATKEISRRGILGLASSVEEGQVPPQKCPKTSEGLPQEGEQ